jgi:hypothetical protein
MQTGYVLCSTDLSKVLCLTETKDGVVLVDVNSIMDINRSICVSDLTEAKNVLERLKNSGLVGDLEIANVARLYKRFF